jgi:BirA family biotin operon repressor/biotin-[acetyl-CoA-carboxylase] ligase
LASKLDEDAVREGLQTRWLGTAISVLEECNSTNDVVKTMAEGGAPHGLVVVAEMQTAGRGRLGHVWYSPRGGIWLSILIRMPRAATINSLPLITALGIARSIERWGAEAKVRWPNDVVVGGRKIGGVLVETTSKGNILAYAVVGLGIDANFDTGSIGEISRTSISMQSILGKRINREKFIVDVLSELEELYDCVQTSNAENLERTLRSYDWSRGQRVIVKCQGKTIEGTFRNYEGLDSVQIVTADGNVRVDTGEAMSVEYQFDKTVKGAGRAATG